MDKSIIPHQWRERFLIKRIDAEDIEIGEDQKDAILKLLADGQRFVVVGKYTLMLNGIRSIDPKYPPNNVPPRPEEKTTTEIVDGRAVQAITNQDELELWDKLYKK